MKPILGNNCFYWCAVPSRPWLRRVLACIALFVVAASGKAATPEELAAEGRASLVFIRVDSDGPPVSGTGFVISQSGYVLTAAHLIPSGTNGAPKIRGAMQSRNGPLEDMELIARDSAFDFALLRFLNTAITRTPVKPGYPWSMKPGDKLFVLGFPLGTEFGVRPGSIAGSGGPNGSWILDANLNPGDSGGPALNSRGEVVFMMSTSLAFGEGIKLILPITFAQELFQKVGVQVPASPPTSTAASPPEVIRYPVSETKDATTALSPTSKDYSLTFQAKNGYKITRADLNRRSDNKLSDIHLDVQPDGQSATLKFRLTSGALYDQWRGWLDGEVVTQQVPQ
ncbi:hypothetical protein R70006_03798 [Paraburkholderia domus]|uniref:S1 family peptidase n=1 Tax=Paraburkholderia domus TaxID=2793075 RepID=UPI0019116AF2|nr:serine protease [Paraburkholderia domus]MBK5047263.1 trypsin-like peptidase domain-containing protein [Burkholderia sp. R-70006]CAE6767721.1 hypothetical protein R70006_03798 [Paraburkholderia domus]